MPSKNSNSKSTKIIPSTNSKSPTSSSTFLTTPTTKKPKSMPRPTWWATTIFSKLGPNLPVPSAKTKYLFPYPEHHLAKHDLRMLWSFYTRRNHTLLYSPLKYQCRSGNQTLPQQSFVQCLHFCFGFGHFLSLLHHHKLHRLQGHIWIKLRIRRNQSKLQDKETARLWQYPLHSFSFGNRTSFSLGGYRSHQKPSWKNYLNSTVQKIHPSIRFDNNVIQISLCFSQKVKGLKYPLLAGNFWSI